MAKHKLKGIKNGLKLTFIFNLMLFAVACSSDSRFTSKTVTIEDEHRGVAKIKGGLYLENDYTQISQKTLTPNQEQFIKRMVNKHGFDHKQLQTILAQANQLDRVIRLMDRQAPTKNSPAVPNGAWIRYKNKFITDKNLLNGVEFWNRYESELNLAYQIYGVPPEIIVGIIGVETGWGRVMGKTRIIDALATLSFSYPRRADYFKNELEDFLLMAREEGVDPFQLTGSFAGAMGYGQFMPSAFRRYAVDFDHNGHIDLWDPVDAIGSVANYFKAQGWQKDMRVALIADGNVSQLEHGFKSKHRVKTLKQAGLKVHKSLEEDQEIALLRLDMGSYYQFWCGLPNFYVITRYNHSTHYAMAVWQLGEAVKKAR